RIVLALCVITPLRLPAQTTASLLFSDQLRQFSSSIESLVGRVAPSVVQIETVGIGPAPDVSGLNREPRMAKWHTIGSGVIVDPEGYIITNAHVIEDAQSIDVVLPRPSVPNGAAIRSWNTKGKTLEATVVGVAEEIDLALIKIEAHGLPKLQIGDY